MPSAALTTEETYCLDLVRDARRGHYAALLYAREAVRGALAALEALDIELSRIPDLVTQQIAGDIRLQWWREAATGEGAYDDGGNPLARALRQRFGGDAELRDGVGALIESHRVLLDAVPFATEAELADHAEARFGSAFRIRHALLNAHLLLNPHSRGIASGEALALAGQARTRCELIERFAMRARSGQCLIPEDLLARHGASVQDVLAGENARAVGAALDAMRRDAVGASDEAEAALAKASAADRQALGLAMLPLVVTGARLAKLSDLAARPYNAPPPQSYLRQLWALWRGARHL